MVTCMTSFVLGGNHTLSNNIQKTAAKDWYGESVKVGSIQSHFTDIILCI